MMKLVGRVRGIPVLLQFLACTALCIVLALPIFLSSSSTFKLLEGSLRSPFVLEPKKIETRFILFKTHKTGSTTLANIFLRFGAKHGLSFLSKEIAVKPYGTEDQRTRGESQMSVSHHKIDKAINSTMLIKWYRKFLPEGQLVSVLRQPLERYVSAFNYFFQPNNPSFTSFLESGNYRNSLARDHGIHTDEHLEHFIQHEMGQFFWFTLEKFEECPVLFKNRCCAPSICLKESVIKGSVSVRSKKIVVLSLFACPQVWMEHG